VIDPDALREALGEAREALDAAAVRSGRAAGAVELVLAGKYVPVEETEALIAAGVRVVGENRLQDLQAKAAVARGRLAFDFIGHLQRRKVRDVLASARLIHSVDSLRLAEEIGRRAEGAARVLVEVNVAEEPTKGGIVPPRLRAFVDEVSARTDLVIGGLMTMPPLHSDPEQSRPHFATLRSLAEDLAAEWQGRHDVGDLSMGTSQDYVVAAEEGATMVRVGRGLLERVRTDN
jgi:PLP dependent protein